MPICPTCKKWIESLGIMRHRQMHIDDKESQGYRHKGKIRAKRHKCSQCGRTRKECYMLPTNLVSRWGNLSWLCADGDCKKDFSENNFFKLLTKI